MRKHWSIFLLGFVLLLVSGPAKAAQQLSESAAQPTEVPLKERVNAYYHDILKGDRSAALDMVAPESKNQFFHMHDDGVIDVRVVDYDFDPSGERVSVKVVRVRRVPGFHQPLDLQSEDVWQRIDGQWYIVLPRPDEMDTPFGKIKLNPENKPNDAEAQAIKQKFEERYRTADPEQYMRALEKAAAAARNKPAGEQPTTAQPMANSADGKQQQPAQPTEAPSADEPKSHQ